MSDDDEEPYYPETERRLLCVTRSGREVYIPSRIVFEPDYGSDLESGTDESVSASEASEVESNDSAVLVESDEDDPDADFVPEEEEEEEEQEEEEEEEGESVCSGRSTVTSPKRPLSADDDAESKKPRLGVVVAPLAEVGTGEVGEIGEIVVPTTLVGPEEVEQEESRRSENEGDAVVLDPILN